MSTTAPRTFCFVLMPFDKTFGDVYEIAIKEACSKAGAYCERVDEQIFEERILDRIYNQIAKADLIIADMTGRNPNVFYEVGYAHALGKPTILLTNEADDIPFDLKHFPHIIYKNQLAYLREELTKRVSWHVANPKEDLESSRDMLIPYLGTQPLTNQTTIYTYSNDEIPNCEVTLHNATSQVFEPGMVLVGAVTATEYCLNEGSKTVKLPDGKYLHTFQDLGVLFPDQYTSIQLIFEHSETHPSSNTYLDVILRLFTSKGVRDYPITFLQESSH